MKFNESNTVEAFVIDQLSGYRMGSDSIVQESSTAYRNKPWKYISPQQLNRGTNQVLLEGNLHQALQRLNPSIAANPKFADEVIYKLLAILLSVDQIGLVRANKAFHNWMTGNGRCHLEKIINTFLFI